MDVALIEVGLGLAVVFLLVATIADGINEFITRTLNTRTKALWATLSGLIQDKSKQLPDIGLPFMAKAVVPGKNRPKRADGTKESDLLNTPSIRGLDYQRNTNKGTKAWHIPGDIFAAALLEIADTKAAGKSLSEKITALTDEYDGTLLGGYLRSWTTTTLTDVDKFIDGVGKWFDREMELLQATYRRNVKYALAAIGLLAALALNVDAIRIASVLHQNASVGEAVAVVGDNISQNDFPDCTVEGVDPLECVSEQISTLEGLDIPVVGDWTSDTWADAWGPALSKQWLGHLLGLLITAGAVSLGGVFWWDFLRWISGARRRTAG